MLEKILDENNIDDKIYQKVYYVYSSIFIKYMVRIFDKNDKYTISYDKMVEIIRETQIKDIMYIKIWYIRN